MSMRYKERSGYLYEVYDDESGKMVFKGLMRQVEDFLGVICHSTLTSAIRFNRRIASKVDSKKYRVKNTGEYFDNKAVSNTVAKKVSHFEEKVRTIEYLLDLYGNTALVENPKKYEKRLNKDGYFFEVEKRPDYVEKDRITGEVIIRSPGSYVITLKRKEFKLDI